MTIRRIFAILLSVAFIVCSAAVLAACGEEDTPTDTSAADTSATEATSAAEATETEATEATETKATEATSAADTSATDTSAADTSATEAISATETESSATETESTATQNEIVIPAQYADVDFGGKTFNVIYRYQTEEDTPSGWGQTFDLYVDETNPDDALSASVKFRAAYMLQRFNCNLVGIASINPGGECAQAIDSGDATYDLCLSRSSPLGYASSRYYNVLPMLDRSLTCWDEAVIRDLAVGNKLYGITGNCSTSDDDSTWVLFFNKDILVENNLELPYQLVRDGKWTIDVFLNYARACAKDLDGDNQISNENGKDIFGLATHSEHAVGIWTGCGIRFVGPITADGKAVVTANALGYEGDIYKKVLEVMWDDSTGYANKEKNMGVPEGLRTVFCTGRAAFYGEILANIGNAYASKGTPRDTEGLSFGILPQPKFNEEQSQYYHFVNNQACFIGVPSTCSYSTATTFLNVYGLMTEQTVQATFISNIALAYVSDANVADMLEIIFASRVWDIGYWYNQSAIYSNLIADIGNNKDRYAARSKSGASSLETTINNAYNTVMGLTY